MSNYTEFKRLPFNEELNPIVEILKENNISFLIDTTKPSVDITFTSGAITEYIVKVKNEEFEKAISLFAVKEGEITETENYYLNGYIDEELLEVLAFPKTWSNFDVEYAKRLVESRNISIDERILKQKQDELLDQLRPPKKAGFSLIFLGYLCSILSGWLGLLIALHLKNKTKDLYGHETAPYYDETSRNHGKWMLYLFVFWLFVYLLLIIKNLT